MLWTLLVVLILAVVWAFRFWNLSLSVTQQIALLGAALAVGAALAAIKKSKGGREKS